ncbi:Uncharacterised protein [Flavonifractor plautii]|uniref:Uncharacterized protein n=1 Tax=Flavonifractor plautii TaxID=292800 RepID=A0A174S8T7_FLAPL|nr:Uncharacterised protein [Flavonifractor plautii]
MKKPSTAPVNSPTARKGTTKPRVYTAISRKPRAALPAEEAISKTLPSVGPTQGVHAKLKVKPSTRATSGFIAHRSSRKGSRCSRSRAPERPNTPNWYRPNRIIMMPLMRANQVWLLRKKLPSAVKPNPSRKKVKLMPTTKNRVLTSTLPLG